MTLMNTSKENYRILSLMSSGRNLLNKILVNLRWAWWYMPVIPATWQRQKDHEFKDSPDKLISFLLKNK
jgi:hypothetical protein